MSNRLRKTEFDEVVVYTDQVYCSDVLRKCREIHKELLAEGKIEGEFNADVWMGYSGIKKIGIRFLLNTDLYNTHIGKEFGISVDTMNNMLRCYAIYCIGTYVYSTIGSIKLAEITDFLEKYKDKDYKLTSNGVTTIKDFLRFIGTPKKQIEQIASKIRLEKNEERGQRQLAPVINYLVIENEINHIYRNGCDDETFKRWFPIYFWVNITFILPLRATEMLVTPKKCIYRQNNKILLRIRRTKLKKGGRTVWYNVDKDYKEFTYEIPNMEVVQNIEKYIALTDAQDRRFLFEYSEYMVNEMLSLDAFNALIAMFVETNIIGNSKYDFAKYATGINEFECVTAGDSRPIAMANLYFQKAGEDICRQLADHVNINTSSGYYTNISETIWASSVIQLLRKLNYEERDSQEQYQKGSALVVNSEKSICTSKKRSIDEENLDDCIEEGYLEDCMGCRYYRPTSAELEEFMESQQKKADDSAKRVIEFMNSTLRTKNEETTLEEVFLFVQTEATRYRMGCNIKVEEKFKEWQKFKNIQKINY